jgi:hypothetical protein
MSGQDSRLPQSRPHRTPGGAAYIINSIHLITILYFDPKITKHKCRFYFVYKSGIVY